MENLNTSKVDSKPQILNPIFEISAWSINTIRKWPYLKISDKKDTFVGQDNNGVFSNECLLYGTSQKVMMNSKRIGHSSVGLNSSMLWITGGKGLRTSEFVTTERAVNGPTIPEHLYFHCSVLFPGNGNVYLIGGTTDSDLGTLVGCFKNKLKSEGGCVNCIWVGIILHYRRAPSLTYNASP